MAQSVRPALNVWGNHYTADSGVGYDIFEVHHSVYLVRWETGEVDVYMGKVDGMETTTEIRSWSKWQILKRYIDKYANRRPA